MFSQGCVCPQGCVYAWSQVPSRGWVCLISGMPGTLASQEGTPPGRYTTGKGTHPKGTAPKKVHPLKVQPPRRYNPGGIAPDTDI